LSLSEFELIQKYFTDITTSRTDVVLGIGDDCSLLKVPENHQLAVSIDTLVSGRHFYPDVNPYSLGHKALAVNLSDLAAMGATPAWVTLAITLPAVDEQWLADFSSGFSDLAKQFNVQLIGGDTTKGPLSMSIQVHGFIPNGQALCRSGATEGDLIYVSGTLGDAAFALASKQSSVKLDKPIPRIELGLALRNLATSTIDISDGLLGDLGHICKASQLSALVELNKIPLSSELESEIAKNANWDYCLSGGDDYELCFTISSADKEKLEKLSQKLDLRLTCIGSMLSGSGIQIKNNKGEIKLAQGNSFDHFK